MVDYIIVAVSVLRSGRDMRQMLRIGKGELPECMVQTQLSFELIWPQVMAYAYVLVGFLDAD